jgi:hypothetical protein
VRIGECVVWRSCLQQNTSIVIKTTELALNEAAVSIRSSLELDQAGPEVLITSPSSLRVVALHRKPMAQVLVWQVPTNTDHLPLNKDGAYEPLSAMVSHLPTTAHVFFSRPLLWRNE